MEAVDLPDKFVHRQQVAALADPAPPHAPIRTPVVIAVEPAQGASPVKQNTFSKLAVDSLDVVTQAEKPTVDEHHDRFSHCGREPDGFSRQGGETLAHPGKIQLLRAEQQHVSLAKNPEAVPGHIHHQALMRQPLPGPRIKTAFHGKTVFHVEKLGGNHFARTSRGRHVLKISLADPEIVEFRMSVTMDGGLDASRR